MKRILFILSIFIISCQNHTPPQSPSNIDTNAIVTIQVEGMTCEGCENAIEMNVKELNGIEYIKASHLDKYVKVILDTSKVTLPQIKDKITETGYKVIE